MWAASGAQVSLTTVHLEALQRHLDQMQRCWKLAKLNWGCPFYLTSRLINKTKQNSGMAAQK